MNIRKLLIIFPVCWAVALSGCMLTTSPQTVASFDAQGGHSRESISHTDYSGQYSLYSVSPDRNDRRKTLVRTVHLNKKEPIGFRTGAGNVTAIVGDSQISLKTGFYHWELKADPGQIDWPRTTVLVIVIVAVVIVVIAAGIAIAEAAALPGFLG